MTTKKIIAISLFMFWAITAAILTAGLVFYQKGKDGIKEEAPRAEGRLNTGNSSATEILSLEEAAKHNSAGDCRLVIRNKVYSVSSYLSAHPGGAETIIPFCGKDATAAFEGRPHSEEASNILESYYIGDIGATITVQTQSSAPNQSSTFQPASAPYRKWDDDDD